jgi:hypothetical protein
VHAAALRVELYLRECRSLKTKRSAIRPIVEGLRKRYRVSAAEVDHQDTWHRSAVGIAVVAGSHSQLVDVLDDVERFVWSFPEVEVLGIERRWLDEK